MSIISITTDISGNIEVNPRRIKILSTDSLATVLTAGYLNPQSLASLSVKPTDFVDMIYNYSQATNSGTHIVLVAGISGGVITLYAYTPVGTMTSYDITLSAAALASAGKVTIVPGMGSRQYVVRDIKMNYSAAGLSGGGGNRLVTVTDGTTVYNNAGITAALLGTPINTVWAGTGNPVAGTVAQDTPTVAGAALYANYAGGTTDYTTGSVVISVTVQRTA